MATTMKSSFQPPRSAETASAVGVGRRGIWLRRTLASKMSTVALLIVASSACPSVSPFPSSFFAAEATAAADAPRRNVCRSAASAAGNELSTSIPLPPISLSYATQRQPAASLPPRRPSVIVDGREIEELGSSWKTARGGGRGGAEKGELDYSATAKGSKSLVASSSSSAVSVSAAGDALAARVDSVRSAARKMKRREIVALLLLRLAFILLLPFSIIFLSISLVVSTLLTALRILSLTFLFRDVGRISYASTRALLAFFLSCLTGPFSPVFAAFGLIAAASASAVQMAEPIIRIRYRRQMRRIRHLHRLVTDPILLETLGGAVRGARIVAAASSRAIEASAGQVADAGRSAGRGARAAGKKAATAAVEAAASVEAASAELVEALLSSPGAVAVQAELERRAPGPMAAWARDQFDAVRRSGILEAAAAKAIDALKNDLAGAVAFLPYLEAIEEVRRRQLAEIEEKEKRWRRAPKK